MSMTGYSLAQLREQTADAPRLIREAVEAVAECWENDLLLDSEVLDIICRWQNSQRVNDRFGK